jgi:nucleotidyltransferase substrate binding protein (TIGR01987 family)
VNIKTNHFNKAIDNLYEVMQENKTNIVRDSAIKRYEICYELAWKSIQEFLKQEGLESCKSPKQCFKEAFYQGLIDEEVGFSDMVENRNLTTHTYDEKLAEIVYQSITGYLLLFKNLYQNLISRVDNEK